MTNMLWAAKSVTDQKLIVANSDNSRLFYSNDRLKNVKAVKIMGNIGVSDTAINELNYLHIDKKYPGLSQTEKDKIKEIYQFLK